MKYKYSKELRNIKKRKGRIYYDKSFIYLPRQVRTKSFRNAEFTRVSGHLKKMNNNILIIMGSLCHSDMENSYFVIANG